MLVDSHCHLDFPDFAPDFDAMLDRAADAGVGVMQTICVKVSQFDPIRAIAEAHENVFCSVGVHPHHAGTEPEISSDDLLRLADDPKVVGIGETGLDFYYDNSPRPLQEASFRRHIAASRASGLPLIVHSRAADRETGRILREEAEQGAFPGVIHCFSSGSDLARTALELGLYISFSGIVTFKKADDIRAVARNVPLERMLVETDAPFLAPVPHRGKRNEPAYIARTAACLATLKDIETAEIARTTTRNFFELFEKAKG